MNWTTITYRTIRDGSGLSPLIYITAILTKDRAKLDLSLDIRILHVNTDHVTLAAAKRSVFGKHNFWSATTPFVGIKGHICTIIPGVKLAKRRAA